ncbi:hypothetical protein NP493_30g00009 [Ridgeia piscesae]|uniref:Major intrinsic protein n=1 Tax=Ridgeia piscesae TaxID=27915 RepID=A0AAD9UK08_RIDPI|nr:hypothetical protein NP493_30g00009 [Ridgeia piscesae]
MDPEMMANLAMGEGRKRMSWMPLSGSIFGSLHDRHKHNKEPEKINVRTSTPAPAITTHDEPETFFNTYVQPSCVELLGVALYVWVSSLVAQTQTSGLTNGIVNGLLIAALGYSFGKVSVMASGHLSVPLAASFVGCQIIGSILGAVFALAVMSFKVSSSATGPALTAFDAFGGGVPELGDGVQWWQGVLCEAGLTFLWVTTVLMTSINRRTTTDLSASGRRLCGRCRRHGRVSGGSMNPARSFGPTVVMTLFDRGVWRGHVVYLIGPTIGGLLATVTYRSRLLASRPPREDWGLDQRGSHRLTAFPLVKLLPPSSTTIPSSSSNDLYLTTAYNLHLTTAYNLYLTTAYNLHLTTAYNLHLTTAYNLHLTTAYNLHLTTAYNLHLTTAYNLHLTTAYNLHLTTEPPNIFVQPSHSHILLLRNYPTTFPHVDVICA